MLDFPLHEGFFPQIALSTDELKYYRRLGKERVAQLVRVIEDADCAYKWTDVATARRHRDGSGSAAHCQKAQFLDFHPANKVTVASTLLKASVHIADARVDEVLTAIAKSKTKDFRKTMKYLHGASFIDGRTLFTFPTPSATASARPRPVYSYRAIKWHVMKRKHARSSGSSSSSSNQSTHNSATNPDNRALDFAYLEYAGKRKPPPGSNVVGFCVQESIAREREIPTLESFGIARGYLARTGIVVSRTHQANMLKVTAICQVDGDVNPLVRSVLESLLQESVCAVTRIKGLLERQRVSSLRFVEQWQWVPNADRKACAVCLRGFYFHRKHHCRTCGEVVCSACAPLRELEEPIFDITQLRVCSVCMASASAAFDSSLPTIGTSGNPESSTSNGDTESYIRGLRSPQHNAYEDMAFQMRETRDRDRRASDAVASAVARDRVPSQQPQQSAQPQGQGQGQGPPRYRHPAVVAPQEKMQALTAVVSHIRDIRDTINLSLSEVDYASGRNGGDGNDPEEHERPDDDDDDGRSDSDEIFNDIRSRRMHEIRATLESSVHNFDAALANATHAPVYPHKRAPRPAYPDETGFKSTRTYHPNDHGAGGDGDGEDDDDLAHADDARAMPRPSDCSNYDDNVMTPEQFASVARITFAAARATKQAGEAFLSSCGGSDRDRHSDDDDDAMDDASVRTPDSVLTGYSDGSQDPYAASNYERVMASYQDEKRSRSLDDSDDVYGLDVHGGGGGNGDNGKLAHYSDRPPLKRTKSINPNPSSTRRASEIFQLERKIEELQRSLEDAQRKLSGFEIDEPDPEQRGPLEIVYEESAQVEIESVFEVFGNRSDASSSASDSGGRRESITVRPSLSTDKLVTTYDLVTELRGVMNSSEMTKPTGRRSFNKPLLDDPYAHYQAGPHYLYQQRQSLPSFGAGGIMPSPIPRRKSTHPSPTGSLDSMPSVSGGKSKHADLMNNTASSSASGPHGHSFTSSNGVLVGSHVNADTSLESARYQHLMGSAQLLLGGDDDDDDLSSDGDGDDDDGDSSNDQFVMMGALEEPKLRVRPSTEPPHAALFAKPELEPNTPPRRRTGDRRNTVGEHDETDELRKLMEGLGRPRSNSVPFGSNQLGAGAAVGDAAEKPAWSDNMPNREQSAYHIEQTLREVRSCLSSFVVECPSGRERERKLSSIFKVLRSLHREGVRSKFRTLEHADIRYAKVLKETPSIIRLLKLAGYVSLPQKLTMRRVDQPYIGVILREIQAALKH